MELSNFVKKYSGQKGGPGTPWSGANGVYVVAPSCPTQFWEGERCGNNVPRNVKIGRASGEHGFASSDGKGRLPSYKTYWPSGVTVHAVLVTPSFDRTVHTYKDEALQRETTLRRIFKNRGFTGFGSNGLGGNNGTGRLGSEWIHLPPSEIMNYLLAAGPMRHARDRLYGCTKNKCERVHIEKVSRDVTRLNNVVKSLEYVLDDEKTKKLGIRGRPVVLPRTIIRAAQNATHPLHIYSHLLKANINAEKEANQRRLANKMKRAANAKEAKFAHERLTRIQKRIKRKRLNAAKQRLPRNVAALLPTKDFETAMALRDARKPGRPLPDRRRTTLPDNTIDNTLNLIKKHPNHRRRYNQEKMATARLKSTHQLNQQLNQQPNQQPNQQLTNHNSTCPRQGVVLHRYSKYTYFDVTGDGRCYFYVIIKALGDPLYRGIGKKNNTNPYVNNTYFKRTRKTFWKKALQDATWHDPIDVLYDAPKMGRALFDRGITYVAKMIRTRNDFSQVHQYMLNPIAKIRQTDTDGIYQINQNGEIQLIPELSAKLRKDQNIQKTMAFNQAFQDQQVITFVWRNIPGQPQHYEALIPNRFAP